jgi:hypothetical protein
MSAIEDIAKKYLDELATFLPVACAASAIAGLCLMVNADGSGSAWIKLLSDKFDGYWYFRDVLLSRWNWEILLVAAASMFGPLLTRRLSSWFVTKGCRELENGLDAAYARALKVAKTGGFSASEMDAAQKWKSMRFGAVWGLHKAACFAFSMFLVSLLVVFSTAKAIDIIPAMGFFLVGVYLSFAFSVRYVSAYLPERILLDANIGLLHPRIAEDL